MKFPCYRCGQCCRIYAVTISQAELEILKENVDPEIMLPKFCIYCDTIASAENDICPKCGAQLKRYLFKDDNQRCRFLSKDVSGKIFCEIYLYRPQECRNFLCVFVPPHLRLQQKRELISAFLMIGLEIGLAIFVEIGFAFLTSFSIKVFKPKLKEIQSEQIISVALTKNVKYTPALQKHLFHCSLSHILI